MCNRHARARVLTAARGRAPSATPGRVADVRCPRPRQEGGSRTYDLRVMFQFS